MLKKLDLQQILTLATDVWYGAMPMVMFDRLETEVSVAPDVLEALKCETRYAFEEINLVV